MRSTVMMGAMILAAGVSLALETTAMGHGQGTTRLPPEAQRLLDRALELTNRTYAPAVAGETPAERARKLRDVGRAFAETLSGLAAQLDEPLARQLSSAEGRDIATKLGAIAVDRKTRAPVYEEIERNYVEATIPFPRPRATTTPKLRDSHATEKYRLAWEFLLLRPPEAGASQAGERALEALAKIRNDASIPTLLHLYRLTSREGIPLQQVDTTQTHLLTTLSAFRSERGLRAMLECALLSKRQKAMKGAGESAWDAERFVRETLAGKFGDKDEWRKLASALSRDGLTVEERQLLEPAREP